MIMISFGLVTNGTLAIISRIEFLDRKKIRFINIPAREEGKTKTVRGRGGLV
jgi:hypothetical protein